MLKNTRPYFKSHFTTYTHPSNCVFLHSTPSATNFGLSLGVNLPLIWVDDWNVFTCGLIPTLLPSFWDCKCQRCTARQKRNLADNCKIHGASRCEAPFPTLHTVEKLCVPEAYSRETSPINLALSGEREVVCPELHGVGISATNLPCGSFVTPQIAIHFSQAERPPRLALVPTRPCM